MCLELTIPKNYACEKKEKASGENNIILHSEQAALQEEIETRDRILCLPKQRSSLGHTTTQLMLKTKASAIHAYRPMWPQVWHVARQSVTFTSLGQNPGTGIVQLIQRPTKKPVGDTDAGSSPWCGKGLFSRILLSVQTLLRCPYSPRVQSHASTSVRALKIPKHWQPYTIVWTHENTAHMDRNG